jgi:hypothetical protein
VTDELIEQAGGGMRQTAIDVESLAAVFEVLVALVAFERQRNLNFGSFLQALNERDAPEGGGEVDVEFDAIGAIRVIPNESHETQKWF